MVVCSVGLQVVAIAISCEWFVNATRTLSYTAQYMRESSPLNDEDGDVGGDDGEAYRNA